MQKFLISLFLVLSYFAAQGQEDNLQRLLREREALNQQYQYYNAQNSNFWGKKSKKDLLKIIDTLKEIINKDSEIIREINISSLKKQAQVTVERNKIQNQVIDDKLIVTDNFYELKTQLNNLQNVQKVKQREINNLQERLVAAQKYKNSSDKLLALAALVLAVLILYIFTLRRHLLLKKENRR